MAHGLDERVACRSSQVRISTQVTFLSFFPLNVLNYNSTFNGLNSEGPDGIAVR